MVSKALDLLKTARESGIAISVNEKGELQLKFAKGVQIEPQLLQDLKDNKELITSFLTERKFKSKKVDAFESELSKINRSEVTDIPLSFSQERLWFIDQLEGTLQYHLPAILRLKGELNQDALIHAFTNIVDRHEVLRTVYRDRDGQAFQHILGKGRFQLAIIDSTGIGKDQAALSQTLEKLVRAPFDLSNDHMVRVALLRVETDEYLLVVTMHHIASDGWSMSIIVNEVAELYRSYLEQRPANLNPLPIQYADYAIWQRKFLQGDVLNKKLDYWKEKLSGTTPLQIPIDHPRPLIQSTKGATIGFQISKDLSARLNEFSHRHEVTLFMTLLSAFKVLLYRYSGQKDICIGTPIAGRQYPEIEGLIGFFINTLVLRTEMDGAISFTYLVKSVKATTMQAYEHQEVPVEKIVELVMKERDLSRSPLFQCLFALQNIQEAPEVRLGNLMLSRDKVQGNTSKLDISFYLSEFEDGLRGNIEYCTDLFDRHTIEQMIVHFRQLLGSLVENPEQSIDSVPLVNKVEERKLVEEFNITSKDYPKEKSLVHLFEEQAALRSSSTAIIFENHRLSYQVLNERANQLAHYLRKRGVKEESIVPVCIERGTDMIIALLAVLKAGAAYTPIDPDYPEDRIGYMVEDTGASTVITSRFARPKINTGSNIDVIEIDTECEQISNESTANFSGRPDGDNLAYVIYTSGSTGRPKGVMIEHRSVINLVNSIADQTGFVQDSSFLSVTTFSFDICYLEFYVPLMTGATLVVASRETAMDGFELANAISQYRPSHMQGTPSTWQLLLDADWRNSESLIMLIGGEAVKESLKNQLVGIGEVYNVYGPTETTIWSASTKLETTKKVVIGKPLANTTIYILNEQKQLCPPGIAGEVCIGGDGVARGYWNRPELTAEKFIKNPFSKNKSERIYRTGDLGRWLNDGNVEYLGRFDDQVKIRGYRIELAEIETVLGESKLVKQAVVVAKDDTADNKILVGYVVRDGSFDRNAVMTYLKQRLPEYMVPGVWVELENLPLTANGKINRKALPDPDHDLTIKAEYVPPRNETEEKLVSIWESLLGADRIGVNDNFFQLGGHSLLAMRAISLLRKQLSVEIGIRDLFLHPTIKELSDVVRKKANQLFLPALLQQPRTGLLPLSFSQERLWFIDRLEGSVHYHMYSVLNMQGTLDVLALQTALKTVVSRHEVLRTVYREQGGQPWQYVQDEKDWELSMEDGSSFKENRPGLTVHIGKLVGRPFDLSNDYMIRATLISVSAKEHLLVVTMHHIASDGWSLSIITKEVTELYSSIVQNRPAQLRALPLQYADYAIWQRKYLQGEMLERKLAYWKSRLEGTPPLQLPLDYPRPVVQSTRGAIQNFRIDTELSESLQVLSQQHDATIFMTLLAALNVMMHRYSGQEDICIGTPIAGRQQEEIEELIGFFVNTLALRNDIKEHSTFVEVLGRVKESTMEAYDYQEVPFEKVVDAVVNERDMSRSPVFQVMLTYMNAPEMAVDLGELTLSGGGFDHTTAIFDITFFITQTADGLKGQVQYCTDLFSEQTIARMIGHFTALLRGITTNPQQKIGTLPMLTDLEDDYLRAGLNNTAADYPTNKTLVDLFEEQVKKSPASIAVAFENDQLTYLELNQRSNQLARYLVDKGVKQETLVPVCLERSLEMMIGILGILKAGGAYVPIDPEYPADRIKYMLDDTGARLLLTTSSSRQKLQAIESVDMLELDGLWSEISSLSNTDLQSSTNSRHLAYVIYTSGSTGKPKGAMNEHLGVVNRLLWAQDYFQLTPDDTVLQKTTFCFDVSVWELFWPLLTGAKLVFAKPEGHKDSEYLKSIIDRMNVTMMHFVPSMLEVFLPEVQKGDCTTLKNVLCSGEALKPSHVKLFKRKLPRTRLHNLYGPTEAAVDVTCWTAPEGEEFSVVPIGKPVANTSIYILNKSNHLVPMGGVGEIHLAGVQVGRGYLNRAELTSAKFVADPFSKVSGAKMYKTGDLGRWLPDGNIEYLGRMDDQVKIRGYRIELGEVETALNGLEPVQSSCVIVRKNEAGDNTLVSYYIPNNDVIREKEKELYLAQIATWKELYDTEYSQTDGEESIDPEFNIIGWNDSFSGKAIQPQIMMEWVKDIVDIILAGEPGKVLEIGCGTGLIYYQLAGKVTEYIGTDFSKVSINQIKERIEKGTRQYGPTDLRACAAHEITLDQNELVDTIVINSVAQYFPGKDYINDVIAKSISLLKGKGRIILGDIRDNRLLELFKTRLQLTRTPQSMTIKEFNWVVQQDILKEEELCFSPDYFFGLTAKHTGITNVEIRWKQASYQNELSLYRYTVVLHVNNAEAPLKPDWHQWNGASSKEFAVTRLTENVQELALRNVPNPRLWQEQMLTHAIRGNNASTVNDLLRVIGEPDEERKLVGEMLDLATEKNYEYRLLVNEDPLKTDIVIAKSLGDRLIQQPYSSRKVNTDTQLTTIPLFKDITYVLQKEIRSRLHSTLPEYMVPAELVALRQMPLTSNGKADRMFLSQRETKAIINRFNYQPARTTEEQALVDIWQELLGLERIGVHDNFFELGGHSLLATRAVSAIRKKLDIELVIKDLFVHPTIALLGEYIRNQSEEPELPPIEPFVRPARIPLSFSQERLWFIHRLEGSVQYHIPAVLRLKGFLDKPALEQAIKTVVNRHEILRTVLVDEDGIPSQSINEKDRWTLSYEDSGFVENQSGLEQYIDRIIRIPFDLTRDHMLRASLIPLSQQEYILVVVMHHIASDGWSLSIIVREVAELYESTVKGRSPRLTDLQVQYADFAIWQRRYIQGEILDRKITYWKNKLEDVAPLQLPSDYPRPAIQSNRGTIMGFTAGKELLSKLKQLSNQEGTTLFMTMLSVFKVLLHHYSGQQDICVGTSVAGRQQQEIESLIGFFINTLALRTDVTNECSFADLLQKVKTTTLEAYGNQEVPFERVVDAVVKQRDMSRNPIFQVLFVLQNTPDIPELRLGEIVLSPQRFAHTTAQFDLTFRITETPEGLQGGLEYCIDVYSEATIKQMLSHFKQLLWSVVKEPRQVVGELKMLSEAERHQLLIDFNSRETAYPADKSIIDLFEEQVLQRPSETALIFEDQVLSYRQLNERSNQLAHYLQAKGVGRETMVPICIERSVEMMVGILGILKAGGVYIPLDPKYPSDRIDFMLEDTAARVAVSTEESKSRLQGSGQLDIIELDSDWSLIGEQSKENLKDTTTPGQLAYIIYTSGSTGKPKGVMVEHKNVVSLVRGVDYVSFSKDDRILSTGSVSFDATTFEYWGALLNGGQLIVCSENTLLNATLLKQEIGERKITKMWFTSSWFNQLVESDISIFEPLQSILVGGEKLSEQHIAQVRQTYPQIQIINGYGPTENTTFSLTYEIKETAFKAAIPIGRPLNNRTAYVVNDHLQAVPIGVAGEICLGGAGLSRGYFRREELTKEKFISNPFESGAVLDTANSELPAANRLYRTGDLGRWLPDGNIEYLGRLDDQVKIRGFRIELGEIESVLTQIGSIRQAVVLVKEDKERNKRLVAYVVAEGGFQKESVTSELKEKLPEYMIPTIWMEMEQLPLTNNGKVDKKALPDPDTSVLASDQYIAPRTATERKLETIWKDLLEIDMAGIHDNFFELGGHSLLAIRLISMIRKELSAEVPISYLFEYPSIAELAVFIEGQTGPVEVPSIKAGTRPDRIPLSFSQERLWFIDRFEGSVQYHLPAVFRLNGELNIEALKNTLQAIVNRHEVLRTVFVHEDGQAWQSIKDKDGWELTVVDGAELQKDTQKLRATIDQQIKKPFDLSKDYMLRASLITLNEQENLLIVTMHHIASDGWSASILVKEVVELYQSFEEGRAAHLPSLEIQYADFAIWQQNYLKGELLDQKINYWKEKLGGVSPLELPTDFIRPAVWTAKGAMAPFVIEKDIAGQLLALSQQQGTTLFMTLLSVLNVLLRRYSGQNDICVGSGIAGRQQQEVEGLIGFFINSLALRNEVDDNVSFTDLLHKVKETTLGAYANQEVPFEKVVDAIVRHRDMSRNPIFQVMFVLQNTPEIPELKLGNISLSRQSYEHTTAQFDLSFSITETASGLKGSVEYCTDLYTKDTVDRLIRHFKYLLSSVVKEPGQKVGLLSMLGEAEKSRLMDVFSTRKTIYPADKSIIDLFEEQVLQRPSETALIFEDQVLSYRQLNERSNQLAHYLQAKGVGRETMVPICIERSVEMMVGILGILKAGGVYIPLDPKYPSDRIGFMLEDTAARVAVSTEESKSRLQGSGQLDIIELDSDWSLIGEQSKENLKDTTTPGQLAYIIYTSGSTGKPKGVMVEHKNVVSLVRGVDYVSFSKDDRILSTGSVSFDATTFEYWGALLNGGQLIVCSENTLLNATLLKQEIGERKITKMWFTSSWFNQLVESDISIFEPLQSILVGGEKLSEQHIAQVRQTYPQIQIINGYGPTENTTFSLTYEIKETAFKAAIPIGRPLNNRTAYVVNDHLQAVPIGVAGEICLGGAGLSRGYFRREELTKEKFISNPFESGAVLDTANSELPTANRLYRTGDLGRWLPDGNIEYLGRLDDQVKIRGFRIELGEIESVLTQIGSIRQAVVLVKEDKERNKRLVAYVVAEGGFQKESVTSELKEKLPEYMIPTIWMEMEQLPLTNNGKVDKKALPDPVLSDASGRKYVAPRTELEVKLVEIWQDLLKVEKVGVEDNFFELGGHSLLAMRMVSYIERNLLISIPIQVLFKFTCISDLSKYLDIQAGKDSEEKNTTTFELFDV